MQIGQHRANDVSCWSQQDLEDCVRRDVGERKNEHDHYYDLKLLKLELIVQHPVLVEKSGECADGCLSPDTLLCRELSGSFSVCRVAS